MIAGWPRGPRTIDFASFARRPCVSLQKFPRADLCTLPRPRKWSCWTSDSSVDYDTSSSSHRFTLSHTFSVIFSVIHSFISAIHHFKHAAESQEDSGGERGGKKKEGRGKGRGKKTERRGEEEEAGREEEEVGEEGQDVASSHIIADAAPVSRRRAGGGGD